jgi:hypothetical protein
VEPRAAIEEADEIIRSVSSRFNNARNLFDELEKDELEKDEIEKTAAGKRT